MAEKIAKLITIFLHPLLMPAYGMLLILNSDTYLALLPFDGKFFLIAVVLLGTLVFPLSFIPVLNYFRMISNVELDKASERRLPLLFTSIVYFITFYLLQRFPIPMVNTFLLIAAICVFLNFLINLKWKISAHMIGIGGLTGLISALSFRMQVDIRLLLILVLLISGFVGFARLKLEKHTPAQVYWGYFVGLFTTISVFQIVNY